MTNIVKEISKLVNDDREADQAERAFIGKKSKKELKANLARLETRKQDELREIENTFFALRHDVQPDGFARLLFRPQILTSELYFCDVSTFGGTTFHSTGTWVILYRRGEGLAVRFDPERKERGGRDTWSTTRFSRFSFKKLSWVVSNGDYHVDEHESRESAFKALRFSIAKILK